MTGDPLVQGTRLSRTYTVSDGPFRKPMQLKALIDASFQLQAGRTLSVVGESGSGKSTLARLVTMIEPPSAGKLLIDGKDVTGTDSGDIKALRRSVQMVFQDPYGSLNPRKTVGTIVEEPLKINFPDLGSAERRERASAMLSRVGLRPEQFERYPHMFSGGQRQRVAIARALILHPKVVVADEPVSALDISIQAQVLNLLMELQDEFNLAYMFISHGLSVVQHISDHVMVLYLGRAVEQGSKEIIFSRPRHPYTQALLASTPTVDPARRQERVVLKSEPPSPLDPPSGCAFHKRCRFATDRCAGEQPELRQLDDRQVACHHAEARA